MANLAELKEVVINLCKAEQDATKRGRGTDWEKRAIKALLKSVCPTAKPADVQEIIERIS